MYYRIILCTAVVIGGAPLLYAQKKASSPSPKEHFGSIRPAPKREVVDRVLATIYHPEGIVLVCQSDLRPGLSGQTPSLRDALIKELIILDGKVLTTAKLLHMGSTEEEVEKALSRAQEQLKMTRDELIQFFKEQGLTLEEAKKELARGLLVENVIDARVRTKAQVSNKAIEHYYNEHPIVMYSLKQATVPFGSSSKKLTRALIEQEIASGQIEESVRWIDLGAIPDKDFAPEKAFMKELPAGSVVISAESDEGITLLKLVAKRVTPLEERKSDIANTLSQERYVETQKTYFERLLKDAHIRYSDELHKVA
jgi:hypothetical protein